MSDKEFKWFEMPSPQVTKCCGSYNWSVTTGGDYCCACGQVKLDNLREQTAEEMKALEDRVEKDMTAMMGRPKRWLFGEE